MSTGGVLGTVTFVVSSTFAKSTLSSYWTLSGISWPLAWNSARRSLKASVLTAVLGSAADGPLSAVYQAWNRIAGVKNPSFDTLSLSGFAGASAGAGGASGVG